MHFISGIIRNWRRWSPKIRELQSSIFQSNAAQLTQTFQNLIADGFMGNEKYSGESVRVIDTLLLSSIYWVPFCKLKNTHGPQVSFPYHAWSVLYPYLTDDGKKELAKIVSLTQD